MRPHGFASVNVAVARASPTPARRLIQRCQRVAGNTHLQRLQNIRRGSMREHWRTGLRRRTGLFAPASLEIAAKPLRRWHPGSLASFHRDPKRSGTGPTFATTSLWPHVCHLSQLSSNLEAVPPWCETNCFPSLARQVVRPLHHRPNLTALVQWDTWSWVWESDGSCTRTLSAAGILQGCPSPAGFALEMRLCLNDFRDRVQSERTDNDEGAHTLNQLHHYS